MSVEERNEPVVVRRQSQRAVSALAGVCSYRKPLLARRFARESLRSSDLLPDSP
jgi:hypothetical protein